MTNDVWRWADPDGQQRRVRLDELRAALAGGHIAPNTPVWKPGWAAWQSAGEVPELTSASVGGANGVVLNIPPPPLAMVAVQQDYEKKSESLAPAPVSVPPMGPEPEPPPPPRYVPAESKMPSMHPMSSASMNIATQIGGSAPIPIAPIFGPDFNATTTGTATAQNIPTTLGMPAPSAPLPSSDLIEELSNSALDDGSQPQLPVRRLTPDPYIEAPPSVRGHQGPLFLHDPPARGPNVFDRLVSDLKRIRAKEPMQNAPIVFAAGGLAVLLVIGFFATIISLARGGSSSSKTVASASASASSKFVAPPTPVSAPPTAVVTAPPPPAPAKIVLGDCKPGEGKIGLQSERVYSGAAMEAQVLNGAIAFGFASTPHDAVAAMVDPASGDVTTTARAKAAGDLKRVLPVLGAKGKLAAVGDRVATRRTVVMSSLIDVNAEGGAIGWALHGKEGFTKLFTLDGDAPVEALRAIPLADGHGFAFTFRRDNAIQIGIARGDGPFTADGDLSKIEGLGHAAGTLGSPAIASSGDRVIVAWADRDNAESDWQVRWTTVKPHAAQHEATPLAVPEGGFGANAMSPAVASLGGGRFLLAWTQGSVSNHEVRAVTFAADGSPSGAAFSVSTSGENAGQPSIAINDDGKGVVGYLVAPAKAKGAFSLHGAPLTCPRQP